MTMATSYPAAGIAAAIAHALAATNDRANPALDDGVIHTRRASGSGRYRTNWRGWWAMPAIWQPGAGLTTPLQSPVACIPVSMRTGLTQMTPKDGLMLGEELSQRLYELFWPGGLPAPAYTPSQ